MRRTNVVLILLVVVVGAIVICGQAGLKPHRAVGGNPPPSVQDDAIFVLHGTLSPIATVPIDARNLRLAVPVNTWVWQGESLGEADSERAGNPEGGDARVCREIATTAIALAQHNVQEIGEEIENARSEASELESQLISSQPGELETERDFERRDTLFRQELASQQDHEAAVSERALAESALATARSRLAAVSASIGRLEFKALAAQSRLDEIIARNQEIEVVSQPAGGRVGTVRVVSPADGLVVSGVLPGTYGIAADTSLLRGHAQVTPAQLGALRMGQPVSIAIDQLPALHARISGISRKPVGSFWDPRYPVELSVENPASLRLEDTAVSIAVQR
jgi:hypothetical protein